MCNPHALGRPPTFHVWRLCVLLSQHHGLSDVGRLLFERMLVRIASAYHNRVRCRCPPDCASLGTNI